MEIIGGLAHWQIQHEWPNNGKWIFKFEGENFGNLRTIHQIHCYTVLGIDGLHAFTLTLPMLCAIKVITCTNVLPHASMAALHKHLCIYER